jgi:hypothetical protein
MSAPIPGEGPHGERALSPAEPLDDLWIRVLQGSSLDPCPQAAEEILWLRSVRDDLLSVLQEIEADLRHNTHASRDAIYALVVAAISKATGE